jgi:hypothetical protein
VSETWQLGGKVPHVPRRDGISPRTGPARKQ